MGIMRSFLISHGKEVNTMKARIAVIALCITGIVGLSAGIALAAVSDTVGITATVGTGVSSVAVTEDTVAFGAISGTEVDHRHSAGPMTVTYFAANDAWTIRTFTTNDVDGTPEPEKAGLVGADTTTFVPLKVWNANFGPGPTMPDPENDLYWLGDPDATPDPIEAVWLRIPEQDEHVDSPADPTTWRRLTYNGAELNPAGFENYLGVDVQGVKTQTYSTTLTVEIIHQ